MLANLMIGLLSWTLGSVVLGLIASRLITFHVREDRPVRGAKARHKKVA